MFNLLKIFLYKFIPTYFYHKTFSFYKKSRLKKTNFFFYKKKNYETISKLFEKKKNKEKIFIFGSGPSIKDLNYQNYKEIRSHCSIGINKWIFHEFITDYYMIELKTNKDNTLDGFNNLNKKYRERIIDLLKIKKKKTNFFYILSKI